MKRSGRWHTAWRCAASALTWALPKRSRGTAAASGSSGYGSSVAVGVSDGGFPICDLPVCGPGPRKVEIESMFHQPAPPPIVNKDSSSLADEASPSRSWRVVGADGSTTDFNTGDCDTGNCDTGNCDTGPTREGPIVEVAADEAAPEANATDREITREEQATEREEESRVEPTRLRASLDLLESKIGSRSASTTRQNIGMPRANTELSSMLHDRDAPCEAGEHPPIQDTPKVPRQRGGLTACLGAAFGAGLGVGGGGL